MNFDGAFVHKVMQILHGGFTMTQAEADALSALVGSREEFLAWLLLRDDLAAKHREIGEALLAASASVVVSVSPPRTESGFPIFERNKALAVEAAMKSLIDASESSRRAARGLQEELGALASHQGRMQSIRHTLGLNASGEKPGE